MFECVLCLWRAKQKQIKNTTRKKSKKVIRHFLLCTFSYSERIFSSLFFLLEKCISGWVQRRNNRFLWFMMKGFLIIKFHVLGSASIATLQWFSFRFMLSCFALDFSWLFLSLFRLFYALCLIQLPRYAILIQKRSQIQSIFVCHKVNCCCNCAISTSKYP